MGMEPQTGTPVIVDCPTGDRFDLPAIGEALLGLSHRLHRVNRRLDNHHVGLDETSVNRLVQGYALLDHYLADRAPLFCLGQSMLVLALNHCVLFGRENIANPEYAAAFDASESHFYGAGGHGGIAKLFDWYLAHEKAPVWIRAAGVYLHTIGPPQLFVEGNHRTGVLLANHVLGMSNEPPLVIDHEMAPFWFRKTEQIRSRRRQLLDPTTWMRSAEAELGAVIRTHVSTRYLRDNQTSE